MKQKQTERGSARRRGNVTNERKSDGCKAVHIGGVYKVAVEATKGFM